MMPGKHKNWHSSWRRDGGTLWHDSGLRVSVARADGDRDYDVAPESLEAFQAFELARGVPLHDILQRLRRLIREAREWDELNP